MERIDPIRGPRRTVAPIPPLVRRLDPEADEGERRREGEPRQERPRPRPPHDEPGEGHVDVRA